MEKENFESQRAIRHIRKKIKELDLNLQGINVLTEIGTNAYFFTPFIALLAGANKVYIWAKDNKYAQANVLKKKFIQLASHFNFNNYEFALNKRQTEHISKADIITNLGALRPIDKKFLQYVKRNSVISLMYDAWEYRKEEIDIDFCKKNSIKVVGVNESTEKFPIFVSVEQLALKMTFEAGYEVYDNKTIVWSDDKFGTTIKKAFEKNNANQVVLLHDEQKLQQNIKNTDFIFFCDYFQQKDLCQIIDFNILKKINPNFGIIHLYGQLNWKYFEKKQISVFPKHNGRKAYMSKTLAHLGLYPTLNLNIAGLKAAICKFKKKDSPLIQTIIQ